MRRCKTGKSTGASGSPALGFAVIAALLCREIAQVRKLPIILGVIDAIADHEMIGNGEAEVIDHHRRLPPGWLVQKGAEPDTGRPFLAEMFEQPGARSSRVNDVLDDQHILAGQGQRRIEMQRYLAA